MSLQIGLAEGRVTYLCFLVLPEPYHCPKGQSSGEKGPLENKTGLPWKGELQRFSAEIALIKNFRLALLGARERFGSDAGGASGIRTHVTIFPCIRPTDYWRRHFSYRSTDFDPANRR